MEIPSNLSDLSTGSCVKCGSTVVAGPRHLSETTLPGPFQKYTVPGPTLLAEASTSLPRSSRMTWRTSCMLLCGAWLCSTFNVLVYSWGSRYSSAARCWPTLMKVPRLAQQSSQRRLAERRCTCRETGQDQRGVSAHRAVGIVPLPLLLEDPDL